MSDDIRYQQRFNNFQKALAQLESACQLLNERGLSDLEKQGLIQAFEYTHELAWKTIKDYLIFQGSTDINGSRDATRGAFKIDLIEDGENWMQMIQTRNITSHVYEEKVLEEAVKIISSTYLPLFIAFKSKMSQTSE